MIYYAALEKFDSGNSQRWQEYIRWLGRSDLQRVVTLDSNICSPRVHVESGNDWEFVAREEFMLDFFTDLNFVLRRAAGQDRWMVVAVMRDPSAEDVAGFSQPNFEFAGFDVVDTQFISSALLNASKFPNVLKISELSANSGLVPSRERAFEIRDTLRWRYPKREHSQCYVWAVWRYTATSITTG